MIHTFTSDLIKRYSRTHQSEH